MTENIEDVLGDQREAKFEACLAVPDGASMLEMFCSPERIWFRFGHENPLRHATVIGIHYPNRPDQEAFEVSDTSVTPLLRKCVQEHTLLALGPMARRLRVATAWLRNEADAGRVPCLKAGKGRYLFAPPAVMKVLAARAAEEVSA